MIVHETLAPAIRRREPLVVAPIADPETLSWAASAAISQHCDVIELRIDALTGCLDAVERFAGSCDRPILLTVRDQTQGGTIPLSLTERAELYSRFIGFSSALDIEVEYLTGLSAIVETAQSRGTLIVASAHDFDQMPSRSTLDSLASRAADNADILKIAATPANLNDVFTLANIATGAPETLPASVMGMGPLGRLSRLVCAQAGSVLNYGYLSKPNAPGQWPSSQLKSLIAQLVE